MQDWPDTEQLLHRLREWIDQTRAEAESLDDPFPDNEPVEAVGLYQLVEQLTALRHETKLLTKASRSVEERNEATLLQMQAAIEQFRSVDAKETAAAENATRPLVETIIELDESLARGRRAMENAARQVAKEAGRELSEARERLEKLYRAQPWWRRALCRPWHAAAKEVYCDAALESQRNLFASLLEGYELIQTRLKRAMDQQTIIRMQCVGQQADPNCMTVLEAVSDTGRPPGMVVEEVRPGYYWCGKVFRFAEVKAVGER